MEEQQGKVCTKCGVWKPLEEYHKDKTHKDGRRSQCKECASELNKQKWLKKRPKKIKEVREGMKKCTKCGEWKPLEEYHKDRKKEDGRASRCKKCKNRKKLIIINEQGLEIKVVGSKNKSTTYWRDGVLVGKKCTKCSKDKEISEFNLKNKKKGTYKARCKECEKQYQLDNERHIKEQKKQYYKDNAERKKQYAKDNEEHIKRYQKQYRKNIKENNLQYISNIVEIVRPTFKELNLPIYGYIYKIENIKTGRIYIGQTNQLLKYRYHGGIVKGWIKERKKFKKQKFLDELIKEDFIVTELFDVACCEYHLNVLETYWINHYDSYNNGYNNTAGNYITNDGLKEFIEILQQHNLEFIDGQMVKKAN